MLAHMPGFVKLKMVIPLLRPQYLVEKRKKLCTNSGLPHRKPRHLYGIEAKKKMFIPYSCLPAGRECGVQRPPV
jgi:hypothetical protein